MKLPEGVHPSPEHGQNFLITPEVLARSCDYAELGPEDSVLEIGPGPGALTEQLARRAREVHAIEIDRQFEPLLARLQARCGNLRVLWGDALAMDFPPFNKVVANLPYRPALPLLMKLLEHDFETGVLVVQHRLAQRLAARPGRDGYSRISVTVQRVASLRLLEVIRPHHFVPPPAVDSAMLRIRKVRPRFDIPSPEELRLLLDFLFAQRQRPVGEALGRLAPAAAVGAVRAGLPAALRLRPVHRVRPEDFGLIARLAHASGLVVPALSNETKRKAQKVF